VSSTTPRATLVGLFLLALLAGASASGCRGAARRPEPPQGPGFSVLTYNVNFGGPGMAETVAAIRAAGADLICLQETTPEWRATLVPGLQEAYPHRLFRDAPGAGGMAVLSRWPVRELAWQPTAAGWFPGWHLEAETPLGPVELLALHLKPPLKADGGFSLGAYWSAGSVHRREVRELAPRLALDHPTLVLGDFNEDEESPAVRRFEALGLTNALPEFDRRTPTWRWRTSLGTLHRRFDHILYSQHLYCCAARVLQAGASDHLPVLALFDGRARPAE